MKYNNIIQFIQKIYNTRKFIPLHEPHFRGNEKKYLNDCIDSTFVSSVGKYVDKFEEVLAEYTGAKKTIVTVNGTNALHISLTSVGVQPGDEVITQPLTFIATANSIAYIGAIPVFLDVDHDTMGLSPDKVEMWLEEHTFQKENAETHQPETFNKITKKRIAAIVPVHTFGHPCRIDKLVSVCERYNIPVVEDAAESLGSLYKEKHTGTFGKVGILSFNGNKIITTGGGGMILTNDTEIGEHIKHLTTQAKVPHRWEYIHDFVGYNYRMPNINAALGVAQMENLELFVEKKRTLAKRYADFFEKTGITFFCEPPDCRSNYWLNAVVLSDRKERDEFLKYTNEHNIMTRPVWRLMSELDMFKECQTDDLENAKWLEDRVVNIPSSVV